MLLPKSENTDKDEEDPRAELIKRLQEYERFKSAAEDLDKLPRLGRDIFLAESALSDEKIEKAHPEVNLKELLFALTDVIRRSELKTSHQIKMEPLSIRERMTIILSSLKNKEFITFTSLFSVSEGKLGVVVTFLAMLELLKDHLIEFIQAEMLGPIHLKAVLKDHYE
ncbi:segregation/condensation protein A, partial [Gammaproteobacteria bacterium]|nr:segregation/condensation protein A [Gammaproteobacteria bacterium]